MGVSGCGKSSVRKLVTENINISFFDGNDVHSESNNENMANGEPLNDDDRKSWLETLNDLARAQLISNSCIIGCPALKKKYSKVLNQQIGNQALWVFLSGSFDLMQKRLSKRKNHFMPAHLLKSQFEILEGPKEALRIDIISRPKEIQHIIENALLLQERY